MKRICILPGCGKEIPSTRKRSAKYCSDDHYYEAKVQRTNRTYHEMKKPIDRIRKNEKVLSALSAAQKYGAVISYEVLSSSGFDLSFSTGEIADNNGNIWKLIGNHAYYIDPKSKIVYIWKQK